MTLKLPLERLVDSTLQKYEVPDWVKPYVYKYVKENPLVAVKYAISLIDVKRKKGEVTKTYVRLPNGTEFKIDAILKLLNLFYYGEENIAKLERHWATHPMDRNAEYERHYLEMSEIDLKYTRAIKNLTEGLGHGVGEEQQSITNVFEYISKIESWQQRVIATGIILRFSYAKTFGAIFYRVFYPVSPEFMRSFGKAFRIKGSPERWDFEEAARIIKNNNIDKEEVLELTREVLARILMSIEANIKLAREMKLEKEVKMLADISVAYPFQQLSELGFKLNVDEEVKQVKNRVAKLKA